MKRKAKAQGKMKTILKRLNFYLREFSFSLPLIIPLRKIFTFISLLVIIETISTILLLFNTLRK
jgi:hypothetical protein